MTNLPIENPVAETVQEPPGPSSAIVDLLLQAAHLLRAALSAYFAEYKLTDIRFAVLRILRDSAPAGCSQTELAEGLNQAESSVSNLVERMRNDGLLYRLRSKTDRRKRLLLLTHQGRELLERVEVSHETRMDRLLHHFDPAEQKLLAQLLEKLVGELDRRRLHELPDLPAREPADSKRRSA